MISIIVAIAENYAIGKKGDLLCHLPADLKHFKEITSGKTVMMGERTFYSLPKHPLPNRRNIVLSRTARDYAGCEVYNSLDEALKHCEGDVYIIGGASVYEEAMNRCDELLLTIVDDVYPDADTFFPDFKEWRLVEREEHEKSESNSHAFAFCKYTL